jgi:Saxitoxin biosynthesis operon protein SxtJ
LHEDLTREDTTTRASERSFGITFAVVFTLIALIKFWRGHGGAAYWLAAALVALALAFFWTAPLRPLNRAWFRLSLALYAVVNPVMMGLIFYSTVVPTGLLMRLFGKDPLRLRRDPAAASYWIDRSEDGTDPARMKAQF